MNNRRFSRRQRTNRAVDRVVKACKPASDFGSPSWAQRLFDQHCIHGWMQTQIGHAMPWVKFDPDLSVEALMASAVAACVQRGYGAPVRIVLRHQGEILDFDTVAIERVRAFKADPEQMGGRS